MARTTWTKIKAGEYRATIAGRVIEVADLGTQEVAEGRWGVSIDNGPFFYRQPTLALAKASAEIHAQES